ncbi:MAG: GPR endopeptidase [Clostridia bacterium]|nr:GPR endopeptidase [Clostridia bacterium]
MDFIRSDLACEYLKEDQRLDTKKGYTVSNYSENGFPIIEVDIKNDIGEKAFGRKKGKYITVCIGKGWLYDDNIFSKIRHVVAQKLGKIIFSKNDSFSNILIAGLGNRAITSDALGPLTIDRINVARHLDISKSVFLMSPGIVAKTGIESADHIKSITKEINADCVILIDALAARSVDRLCSTVQISNVGLMPGSGIGCFNKEISKTSLGVSVFSIGVPTIVSSSTMIYDMLNESGITSISEDLKKVLENGKSFFVTPNETDIIVSSLADLLASAIEKALNR